MRGKCGTYPGHGTSLAPGPSTRKARRSGPFVSSGGGIRTRDLRVMSPTSYLTAPPRGVLVNLATRPRFSRRTDRPALAAPQDFVLGDELLVRDAALFDRVPVLFLAAPEAPDRPPAPELGRVAREPDRELAARLLDGEELEPRAEDDRDPPPDRAPALLARVPLERVARVFAARFAEALRASALRLRVRAAFFAASSRFAGPPVARSSSVSARERRSLAVLRSALGAVPPASFAIVAASATVRATFLRTPPALTAL